MNQIVKDFGKGFKQLGVETAEKLVNETGKIAESIITAKELLGDIKPLNDQELTQKKAEDERKKQEEIANVRSQMAGRNVESEIEQISNQKKREENEKEKMFLENLRRQREVERQNQIMNSEIMTPSKHHKDKGGNKHKTQQPDESQMSQTSEFKGKID
ncbi:MAG: hypothetical protein PHE32_01330 [Candidatus Shapirobacteria bacterium]|nr:hypothetical protein [Candidatus Shapirobacteria bacterium]MDD4410331.1 hypothetical protein [Candidatus Shapirobacteria bacterium]